MRLLFLVFIFATFGIPCSAQYAKDSLSIIALLEKESATWRSGDQQGHADCWIIRPYSRILVSTPNGQVMDVPPAVMVHPPAEIFGKGGTSKNSNYKMSIQGKHAWVSHDEESVSKEGVKSYSYEIRILEKIKGQWKLVGQSIHLYNKQ